MEQTEPRGNDVDQQKYIQIIRKDKILDECNDMKSIVKQLSQQRTRMDEILIRSRSFQLSRNQIYANEYDKKDQSIKQDKLIQQIKGYEEGAASTVEKLKKKIENLKNSELKRNETYDKSIRQDPLNNSILFPSQTSARFGGKQFTNIPERRNKTNMYSNFSLSPQEQWKSSPKNLQLVEINPRKSHIDFQSSQKIEPQQLQERLSPLPHSYNLGRYQNMPGYSIQKNQPRKLSQHQRSDSSHSLKYQSSSRNYSTDYSYNKKDKFNLPSIQNTLPPFEVDEESKIRGRFKVDREDKLTTTINRDELDELNELNLSHNNLLLKNINTKFKRIKNKSNQQGKQIGNFKKVLLTKVYYNSPSKIFQCPTPVEQHMKKYKRKKSKARLALLKEDLFDIGNLKAKRQQIETDFSYFSDNLKQSSPQPQEGASKPNKIQGIEYVRYQEDFEKQIEKQCKETVDFLQEVFENAQYKQKYQLKQSLAEFKNNFTLHAEKQDKQIREIKHKHSYFIPFDLPSDLNLTTQMNK